MGPVLHPLPAHLENWRTLSLRIRCAFEYTDLQRSQLEALLDPEKLTAGGI